MQKRDKRFPVALMTLSLLFVLFQTAHASQTAHLIKKELPRTGKTTAPLSVSYEVPQASAVNDKVQVVVTIKPLSDVSGLTLKLAAGEGLSMPTGEFLKNYGDQSRNTTITETVTVIPNVDGILYLHIFASGKFGKKEMGRSGAVPIKVGSNPKKMLKQSGRSATDSKGRKITVMPAEEIK